jgi:hypothetical protein
MSAFSGERERYSFGGWANIATSSSLCTDISYSKSSPTLVLQINSVFVCRKSEHGSGSVDVCALTERG